MSLFIGKAIDSSSKIRITSENETLLDISAIDAPDSTIFSNDFDWMVSNITPTHEGDISITIFQGNTTLIEFISSGAQVYPDAVFSNTINTFELFVVELTNGKSFSIGTMFHEFPTYPWETWSADQAMFVIGSDSYPPELIGAKLKKYTFGIHTIPSSGGIVVGSGDVIIGGESLNSKMFINACAAGTGIGDIDLDYLGYLSLRINNSALGSLSLTSSGIFKKVDNVSYPILPSNNLLFKGVKSEYNEHIFTPNATKTYTIPAIAGSIVIVFVTVNVTGPYIDGVYNVSPVLLVADGLSYQSSIAAVAWTVPESDSGGFYVPIAIDNYTLTCTDQYTETVTLKEVRYISIGSA